MENLVQNNTVLQTVPGTKVYVDRIVRAWDPCYRCTSAAVLTTIWWPASAFKDQMGNTNFYISGNPDPVLWWAWITEVTITCNQSTIHTGQVQFILVWKCSPLDISVSILDVRVKSLLCSKNINVIGITKITSYGN